PESFPGRVVSRLRVSLSRSSRALDSDVMTTPDFVAMLRDASLRVTRPRLAVLSVVHAEPHLDTHAVPGRTRAELGKVSHQAVHDVLRVLTDAGLVRRIQPAEWSDCAAAPAAPCPTLPEGSRCPTARIPTPPRA